MAIDRRPLDFRTFDDLRADVARLREHGYEQAGQWSLPRVLDHLARAMRPAADGVRPLPRPVRWVFGLFMRRMLKRRSMPRVPAPGPLRPPPQVDEADAAARFDAAVVVAAAQTGPRLDHPMFGRVTVDQWQQMQLIHAARHLSFFKPRERAGSENFV